jgi:ATP-dependent RNA circularization protein (DNA/RNA ligase family)
MWCGSRTEWKRDDGQSVWWKALTPEMEEFCLHNPGFVLYGEVYGRVQSLRYGLENGVAFVAFDVLQDKGTFVDALPAREVLGQYGIPQVPLIAYEPFDFDTILSHAEGPSLMPGANHVREGCVVKPERERWHQSVGRVTLKVVGAGYLTT